MLAILGSLSSCSSDEDEPQIQNIVGSWIGVYTYNNPVSGLKETYLYMDFYADGSGKLEYESSVNYAVAYFTYQISGSTISCTGVIGSTADDSDVTDFSLTLRIEGDRIRPVERYSNFILTRDGSITTTGEGEIVEDKTTDLCGVWVKNDKGSIMVLSSNDTYQEYVLDPPGSNNYSTMYTGSYYYNSVRKKLNINGTEFSIIQLDASHLIIQSESSYKQYAYTKGTSADIPKQVNILGALLDGLLWSTSDSKCSFAFARNGSVQYFEQGRKVGSYGIVSLVASGTFSINGNVMTCYYSDVSWEYSSSYPNMFPGWTAGKGVTKTYTVKISDSCLIVITPEGTTMYMYPYKG